MVAEIKSDTTDCTDGRTCLLEAVDGLSTEAFDIANVIGDWSVRDCLAHLVGWDAWVVNALDRSAAGMALGPFPSEREINDAAPGDWAKRPIPELLGMLRSIRDTMAERVSQMTDEERDQKSMQVEDIELSVNEMLDGLIEHDLEHAGQIRSWRKIQGV
ncbi:MAG: DinB family protein [Chloroflexi bacterium]|nr:DinB family protein [Chloroflexota bacterium]MYB22593.1 DinB family protein [Chloroflexota bacterium]MYF23242.1 DinB family protein [Chloroflexota bacterium]MYF81571.1 DinB family protein [Chloroflexota bacterium]MYI05447.1 DinB family protein [Chloroflexota bacterium]